MSWESEVWRLSHFEKKTIPEIARILNISQRTASNLLYSAEHDWTTEDWLSEGTGWPYEIKRPPEGPEWPFGRAEDWTQPEGPDWPWGPI